MANVSRIIAKQYEGCSLTSYWDSNGRVWTIGWGHTGPVNGQPLGPGVQISQDKADALLLADLGLAEQAVENMLVHPATQGQYDAMVDMAYNAGTTTFRNSSVLRYFNQGNLEASAQDLGEYVHSGGAILLGLVRRCVTRVIVFCGGVK